MFIRKEHDFDILAFKKRTSLIIIIIIIIIKLTLSHLIPIIHRSWKVFWAAFWVRAHVSKSLLVSVHWHVYVQESMKNVCRWEIPCFSTSALHVCSSYLIGFWNGRQVAVQLLFCGVLLLGFVQESTQHSWVVPTKIFLYAFC